MKKSLLIAAIAAVLLLVLSLGASAKTPFEDVPDGKWYTEAVLDVYEKELMNGRDGGKFAPTANMTRAEFVTILARLSYAETTGLGKDLTFKDTKATAWYADAVGWASSKGLVNGYSDNTFKPNAPISRQELAAVFVRFLDSQKITLSDNPKVEKFTDAKKFASWSKDAIDTMRRVGLFGGDAAGNFNPKNNASRAEIASMLSRFDLMHVKVENLKRVWKSSSSALPMDLGHARSITRENIGAIILDKLDLDPEVYSVYIPYIYADRARNEFNDVGPDESRTEVFAFTVTNRLTGETTKEKRSTFNIHYDPDYVLDQDSTFIDPREDHWLDEDVFDEIVEKSLTSKGNLARFAKVFAMGEAGEDFTMAYIGGSITEGAGATAAHCWARITTNWLRIRYPNSNIRHVNAGIGGTPSSLGVLRADLDIMQYKPQVIFIEFAVNDSNDALREETFESLVRTALSADNQPAVALVISWLASDKKTEYICNLAEKYGLPVIDVDEAVDYALDKGYFTVNEYTQDDCHPGYFGYLLMGNMMGYMLDEVEKDVKAASPEDLVIGEIPTDTMTECRFVNMTRYEKGECDAIKIDEFGTWEASTAEVAESPVTATEYAPIPLGPGWVANGTDPMKLTVRVNTLHIVTNGEVLVSIDGAEPITINDSRIFLDGGTHVLEISDVSEGPTTIEAFVYN
ncbi:MAG: S-layer homology domain-containing protein [Clostridia bacterium]|nr:S-layer homology domain-containing protein [Clostridia bacterium]